MRSDLGDQLAALRMVPGADLPTLRLVDGVLARFAGQRVTVLAGRKRQSKAEQARALIRPGMTHSEAILAVCRGLGVSRSSGYRYLRSVTIGK